MNDIKKAQLITLLKKAAKDGKLNNEVWDKVFKALNKNNRKDSFNTVVNMDLSELTETIEKAHSNNEVIIEKLTKILEINNRSYKENNEFVTSLVSETEKQTETIGLMRDDIVGLSDETKEVKDGIGEVNNNIKSLEKRQKDDTSSVLQGLTILFSSLTGFLSKLIKVSTFKTQPTAEAFLTPQYVVLYDPHKKTAANLKALGGASPSGRFSVNTPSEINIKNGLNAVINPATEETLQDVLAALGGSSSVTAGDGTRTVTTAGTRVQLSASSVPCRRVIVQAHIANGDLDGGNGAIVVVGGSTCVAEASARRGVALFPNNSYVFEVTNLNSLYIDSTFDGAKVTYTYEVST